MKLSPYVKAVVAAVGGLATAFTPVVADSVFDASEVQSVTGAVVAAVLTVYAVYRAENREEPVEAPDSHSDDLEDVA